MKLALDPTLDDFRSELCSFLDEHAPPEAKEPWTSDDDVIPAWLRTWQATLFDHGWMVPGYPPELGGRNATLVQTLVFLEELAVRGLPRGSHYPGYGIVAPSLLEYGNTEQKALAPAALRGDTIWCIGMSEPNAGSDLASLTTRAELDGERFLVNGQKVWTSYAHLAQKCFCYVRTNPDAPKHKGISVLIIDMDTPGIEVRPLRHITGDPGFAEVFFTDVEVPADRLVGELHNGWRITMGSLAHERGGLWVDGMARLQAAVDRLIDQAKATRITDDPIARVELTSIYEQVKSLRALGWKGFADFAGGGSAPEHSYLKIAQSELTKATHELGLRLSAAAGIVDDPTYGSGSATWVHGFLVSLAGTIAAGSSEIQRNIVAERILGLPRD